MADYTLANNKLLGLDDLQLGVAETIVTAAPLLSQMPFNVVSGNAYAFNREATLVNGQLIAADGTITDSSAYTTNLIQIALKGISGQADVANLNLAQGVGQPNNTLAILTASAAKGVSRKYQDLFVNGTVASNGWDGMQAVFTETAYLGQVVDASAAAFSLDLVDSALTKVVGAKPQWIMGNGKAENAFRKAMRSAGGITTVELNGVYFMAYDGIPFIRNDYIATYGTSETDIFMGTWDDGSATGGVAGIAPGGNLLRVDEFNKLEGKDATRVRVVMYGAAAFFSPVQMAKLEDVTV